MSKPCALFYYSVASLYKLITFKNAQTIPPRIKVNDDSNGFETDVCQISINLSKLIKSRD